jgi:hypothetical protein
VEWNKSQFQAICSDQLRAPRASKGNGAVGESRLRSGAGADGESKSKPTNARPPRAGAPDLDRAMTISGDYVSRG